LEPYEKQLEFIVKLLDKIEHEKENIIGPFTIHKEKELKKVQAPPQSPPPPLKYSSTNKGIDTTENKLLDDEDFLFFLKRSLTDRIISKILIGKKSIKFSKFDDLQDPRMHVRKFQEEEMEYLHDRDLLAKLFSHSLKDDALKWHFQLPKKSIYKYEDIIHQFLQYFKYNIIEKVQCKDLCKIKQLPNQSIRDFVKVWKRIAN